MKFYACRDAAKLLSLQSKILLQQHRDPLARRDPLAIWRDDDVAVRPRSRSHIARALPACQLDLCLLKFARQNGGEKALQAGLSFDLRLQPRMQEGQFPR